MKKADDIINHNGNQDVSRENLQLKRLSIPGTDKIQDKQEFSHKLQLNTKQSKSLDKTLFVTKHIFIQLSNNPTSRNGNMFIIGLYKNNIG